MSQQSHREQTLELSELTRDDRLRFRDRLHHASGKAQEYAEAMREYGGWGEFPPAVVVELTEAYEWQADAEPGRFDRPGGAAPKSLRHSYPAGTMVLVGGFTRCEAVEAVPHLPPLPATDREPPPFDSRVRCRVVSGTWEDALLLAIGENSKHGQGRSQQEREMVLLAVHAHAKWRLLSEWKIAEMTGISRSAVNRWRAKTAEAWGTKTKPATAPEPAVPPLAAFRSDPDVAEEPATPAEAATASAPVLKDGYGRPVPEFLAPLWECVGTLRRASKDIRDTVDALGREKHGHPPDPKACVSPGMAAVDLPTICAPLLASADLIDSQAPFIVCPECDGHGDSRGRCRVCKGLGALTRPQALTLPPALEKKATAFRGVS